MGSVRRWVCAVCVVAIALVARRARPSCDDGLTEQGYDQCELHPNCACASLTITCPKGGWYVQYSVDLNNCVGAGPGPVGGSGSGSGSGSAAPSTPCEMMEKWLQAERDALAAYDDDALLDIAIAQGWPAWIYDEMIWQQLHPGEMIPLTGSAVMWTRWRDCSPQGYDAGCQWLIAHGLPPEACPIALGHEQVHVGQCKHPIPGYDASSLAQHRDREVAALQRTIADIEKYIGAHCR